ncbi:MAG: spore cortex biosynthesis protein YabQ [Acutalibacteraceae bacterium]|nr:spore cortex biosynthesis protein YabQ [Acutalibacteraceae bacterium]
MCFLYSVFLGCGICLFYDVLRIDRAIFKRSSLTVFFEDIFFWIIFAFCVYSFLIIFANGQIRLFILFGVFLGFILFRFTISKLIFLIVKPIKKLTKTISKGYIKLIEKTVDLTNRLKNTVNKTITNNKKEKNNQIISKNS